MNIYHQIQETHSVLSFYLICKQQLATSRIPLLLSVSTNRIRLQELRLNRFTEHCYLAIFDTSDFNDGFDYFKIITR